MVDQEMKYVTLVSGEWRKLHNEELNDLFSSHNIVRVVEIEKNRWAEHVARMGDMYVCV